MPAGIIAKRGISYIACGNAKKGYSVWSTMKCLAEKKRFPIVIKSGT